MASSSSSKKTILNYTEEELKNLTDDQFTELLHLTNEQLVETRPNSRVLQVEPYVSYNKRGKAFQIFCAKDDLQTKGGQAVTLSNRVWH